MRFLIDTHVLAWQLIKEGQDALPPRVRDVLRSGVLLYSPIGLYEIAQKVRIGRWPAMAPRLGGLLERLAQQEVSVAPADRPSAPKPERCLGRTAIHSTASSSQPASRRG